MSDSHEPCGPDCAPDAEIQRKLDRLWIAADSVSTVCQLAEKELQRSIPELVVRIAVECADTLERDFSQAGERQFRVAGSWYEIKIVEDPGDRAVLCVSILPLGCDEQLVTDDVMLKGDNDGGRYTRARLSVPEALATMWDPIGEAMQALYASGYQWLNAHVLGSLTSLEQFQPKDRLLISELYRKVRAELGEYAEHVTLFALNRKDAFFLLDSIHVLTAFSRARTHRSGLAASPLETTSLLATRRLDADLTISRCVISEGRPISENLIESRYANTRVNLAEGVFYETAKIVCQPLVREGRARLTSAYPASMSAEITPRLGGIAEQLGEAVRRSRFSVRRALSEHSASLPSALLRETGELGRSIAAEVIVRSLPK